MITDISCISFCLFGSQMHCLCLCSVCRLCCLVCDCSCSIHNTTSTTDRSRQSPVEWVLQLFPFLYCTLGFSIIWFVNINGICTSLCVWKHGCHWSQSSPVLCLCQFVLTDCVRLDTEPMLILRKRWMDKETDRAWVRAGPAAALSISPALGLQCR